MISIVMMVIAWGTGLCRNLLLNISFLYRYLAKFVAIDMGSECRIGRAALCILRLRPLCGEIHSSLSKEMCLKIAPVQYKTWKICCIKAFDGFSKSYRKDFFLG